MTELDILRHAKGYLDKLADGVDPLTGEPVPADDIVRKEGIRVICTKKLPAINRVRKLCVENLMQ